MGAHKDIIFYSEINSYGNQRMPPSILAVRQVRSRCVHGSVSGGDFKQISLKAQESYMRTRERHADVDQPYELESTIFCYYVLENALLGKIYIMFPIKSMVEKIKSMVEKKFKL